MNIKFYTASQAKQFHGFLNTKIKLHKVIANLWYNKQCLVNKVIPKYAILKYKSNSQAANKTKRQFQYQRIKNEIKFLHKKKEYLNRVLYDLHLQSAIVFGKFWETVYDICNERINKMMENKYETLNKKLVNLIGSSALHTPNNEPIPKTNNKIVNLTKLDLTEKEVEVLELGYKHNYPPDNITQTMDTLAIETQHIINQQGQDSNKNYLAYTTAKIIEDYIQKPETKAAHKSAKIKKKELNNLKRKLHDNNVIHVKADKNDAIVLMNKSEYIDRTLEFISNNQIQDIKIDPTDKFQKQIKTAIKNSPGLFPSNIAHKYITTNPDAPTLKTLPKTHKPQLTMRPVVNSRNAPNRKVNKFLHKFLKQHITLNNQFNVSNSKHLLKTLAKVHTNSKTQLLSLDISNLYTNIPVDETIEIIRTKLMEIQLDTSLINQIIYLLNTSLKQNYFKFNNKFYLQNRGLAMGDPLSGFLTEIFLQSIEDSSIPDLFKKYSFSVYNRYVDDTLIIYDNDNFSTGDILNDFNNLHPNLKFTFESGLNRSINFLDLSISIKQKRLNFNIFRKPTTTNHTIHNTSSHPMSHKTSKFRFLIDRMLNTPLSKANYDKEYKYIMDLATSNGFPPHIITNLIKKRKQLLERKKPVTTLTPENKPSKKKWTTMTYLGNISNKISNILKKNNINVTFRTNNKLCSIIPNNTNSKDPLNCSGIYMLNCKNCPHKYIGQTRRTFRIRFNEHKSDFIHNRNRSKFALHLINTGHELSNIKDTLKIIKTENNGSILNTMEMYYISKAINNNVSLINESLPHFSHPLNSLLKKPPDKKTPSPHPPPSSHPTD